MLIQINFILKWSLKSIIFKGKIFFVFQKEFVKYFHTSNNRQILCATVVTIISQIISIITY